MISTALQEKHDVHLSALINFHGDVRLKQKRVTTKGKMVFKVKWDWNAECRSLRSFPGEFSTFMGELC